jgi:hypothetical protein
MNAIPPKLESQLVLALTNLRLASLSADFLMECKRAGVEQMPTELHMSGPRGVVHLPSTNCGFFVTPVIHCALLDVRRTLEFFRLKWDRSSSAFVNFPDRKYADDIYITDLGLPAVDPSAVLELSMRVIGRTASSCLLDACSYTNKEMAHYSQTSELPGLQAIVDATKVIHEAVLVFVFDALGAPRPKLQPTIHEG